MSGIKDQSLLAKREIIKTEYLEGNLTQAEICTKYDLAHDTLKDWIKIGRYGDAPWGLLKKERQVAQKRELMDKAALHLPSVFKTGSEILEYGFNKIQTKLVAGQYDGQEVEVLKAVADTMLKVYKVLRLDDGKSTSNTAIAVSKIDEEQNSKEIASYLKSVLGEEIEIDARS